MAKYDPPELPKLLGRSGFQKYIQSLHAACSSDAIPLMSTSKPAHPGPDLPAPFQQYDTGGFYDEMLEANGKVRPHYQHFLKHFGAVTSEEFDAKRSAVDLSFLRQRVTFNVYGDS